MGIINYSFHILTDNQFLIKIPVRKDGIRNYPVLPAAKEEESQPQVSWFRIVKIKVSIFLLIKSRDSKIKDILTHDEETGSVVDSEDSNEGEFNEVFVK